jgi:hypothetical protein
MEQCSHKQWHLSKLRLLHRRSSFLCCSRLPLRSLSRRTPEPVLSRRSRGDGDRPRPRRSLRPPCDCRLSATSPNLAARGGESPPLLTKPGPLDAPRLLALGEALGVLKRE